VSERVLRAGAVVLAAAGAALAGYLLYVRVTDSALACSTGGCETVQRSPYAELLGFPVAGLGLAAFLVLLAAALVPGELARLVQAAVALTGVAFSAYLLYVQFALIDAVCQWCLASDALMVALAALALLRLRVAEA
jgi:uncharacterized membrane protein